MKMEFQKITNFLDTNSHNKDLPRFVTKKWIELYDQSQGNYNINKVKKLELKLQCSDQIYVILMMHILL